MDKKNKSMVAMIAVAAIILTVGVTYAFITIVLEGQKTNTITGGSLTVTLDDSATSNGSGDITMDDAFPVSDAVGKSSEKTYTFTLTNSSSKDASYTVFLDPVTVPGSRLEDRLVKAYLTDDTGATVFLDATRVGDLATQTRTVDGQSITSRVLYSDSVLKAATKSGDVTTPTTQTFVLRLWIASDAGSTDNGVEVLNKVYATKVSVDATQVPEYAVVVNNTLTDSVQTVSQAVFEGGNAVLTITQGTGTASVSCTNGQTATVSGTTVTVNNVTEHTVCTVTYNTVSIK